MPLFGEKTQKPWSPQDEARLKRVRLLSRLLDEQFRIPGMTHLRLSDGTIARLGGEERAGGALQLYRAPYFSEFRLDYGLPIWRYQVGGAVLEKQVMLPHAQNTVHITYRLVSGEETVRLKLLPSLHFRAHEAPVSAPLPTRFMLTVEDDRYEVSAGTELPSLRMMLDGQRTAFTVETRKIPNVMFRIEGFRGYEHTGDL
jgi:hypothetical protein